MRCEMLNKEIKCIAKAFWIAIGKTDFNEFGSCHFQNEDDGNIFSEARVA